MRLIPAIDLLDGHAVRLTRGDYATAITYATDPVALARRLAAAGATHLHVVDLNGARDRAPRHLALLRAIVDATGLSVDFSGGLATAAAIAAALTAGATQVIIGSQAVHEPPLVRDWLREFGPEQLIIGADFRDDFVLTDGWQRTSTLALNPFIESWLHAGASTFLCTDVRRDGSFLGPATDHYATLTSAFPAAQILAGGGVGGPEHLTALRATGVVGVVIGKAIYEGRIPLEMLAEST